MFKYQKQGSPGNKSVASVFYIGILLFEFVSYFVIRVSYFQSSGISIHI